MTIFRNACAATLITVALAGQAGARDAGERAAPQPTGPMPVVVAELETIMSDAVIETASISWRFGRNGCARTGCTGPAYGD
jgi:hypothetical protein